MKASKGPYSTWYDKIDGKTQGWSEEQVKKAGFRCGPRAVLHDSRENKCKGRRNDIC